MVEPVKPHIPIPPPPVEIPTITMTTMNALVVHHLDEDEHSSVDIREFLDKIWEYLNRPENSPQRDGVLPSDRIYDKYFPWEAIKQRYEEVGWEVIFEGGYITFIPKKGKTKSKLPAGVQNVSPRLRRKITGM